MVGRLLFRHIQNTTAAITTHPTPPITPPIIGPVGVFERSVAAVVGVAVAELEEEFADGLVGVTELVVMEEED